MAQACTSVLEIKFAGPQSFTAQKSREALAEEMHEALRFLKPEVCPHKGGQILELIRRQMQPLLTTIWP